MTLKAFQKPSSSTPDLDILARSVQDYSEQLTKNPLLDGRLIQGVALSGTKMIDHLLGRPWIGYIVTYKSVAADVSAVRLNTDKFTIQLTASAPATVDIWIF